MIWIYLSPHLDDAVLSCGGLLWEQAQHGHQVEVWTICAGEPDPGPLSDFAQSLHRRWQTGINAITLRRQEDQAACRLVGALPRWLNLPDCIYRRAPEQPDQFLYTTEEDLFGPVDPLEQPLILQLAQELGKLLIDTAVTPAAQPSSVRLSTLPPGTRVVCPLALGGHVDHRLVRQAAEMTGWRLEYYADYPYVLEASQPLQSELGWSSMHWQISVGGLAGWQAGVAAYQSQISTFWPDLAAMRTAIEKYGKQGIKLWRTIE